MLDRQTQDYYKVVQLQQPYAKITSSKVQILRRGTLRYFTTTSQPKQNYYSSGAAGSTSAGGKFS